MLLLPTDIVEEIGRSCKAARHAVVFIAASRFHQIPCGGGFMSRKDTRKQHSARTVASIP
jgi:hypothetical protein